MSDDARLTSWPVCELVVAREVERLQLTEHRGAQVVLHVERDAATAVAPDVREDEPRDAHHDEQREPRPERLLLRRR